MIARRIQSNNRKLIITIIMVAVIGLIDIRTLRHVWNYSKADAFSMIISTFAAVLLIGVEKGILVGAGISLMLFI